MPRHLSRPHWPPRGTLSLRRLLLRSVHRELRLRERGVHLRSLGM